MISSALHTFSVWLDRKTEMGQGRAAQQLHSFAHKLAFYTSSDPEIVEHRRLFDERGRPRKGKTKD
jgi:hypothetical protein